MRNKLPIIGIIFAVIGVLLGYTVSWYSSVSTGESPFLLKYYDEIMSFCFSGNETKPMITSITGFYMTEPRLINIFLCVSFFLGGSSIFLGILSFYMRKNQIFKDNILPSVSILLGNVVFIFYSIKLSMYVSLISAVIVVMLRILLTTQINAYRNFETPN